MRYNDPNETVRIGTKPARTIKVHERMDGFALLWACAKAKPFIPATYHGRGQPITNRHMRDIMLPDPARFNSLRERIGYWQSVLALDEPEDQLTAGYLPTNIDTQTYLFASQISGQPEMDPDVVGSTLRGYSVVEALLAIPTISITTAHENLFGPNGIYTNSTAEGPQWERGASIEWIRPDGGDEFQIDTGLYMHGASSSSNSMTPKHSFRCYFRSKYGAGKLDFPLFDGNPVERFDQLVIKALSTDTWPVAHWAPTHEGFLRWERERASYIRDQWMRDAQIAIAGESCDGRFAHVYLNGVYWGLYNVLERPIHSFQSEHFGGKKDEYDVLHDYYTTDGSDPRLPGGAINPTAMSGPGTTVNTTTQISARAFDGAEWSALNQVTFVVGVAPDASNIVVSEIMYNPDGPDDTEFIELLNISAGAVAIAGMRFDGSVFGIEFTFDAAEPALGPGERIVVVRSQSAFAAKYATAGLRIALGEYDGSGTKLSNDGEQLTLRDSLGGLIQQFTYNDIWHSGSDGGGFSLVIKDPTGSATSWNASEGWHMSYQAGGSPGEDDLLLDFPGRIESVAMTGGGQVQLGFQGDSGRPYVLQASTNLTDWVEIESFTAVDGITTLNDADATLYSRRFYRVGLLP